MALGVPTRGQRHHGIVGASEHVTVNADQAVVTDQVVSGRVNEASTAGLLTSGTDKQMRLIEPVHRDEGGGPEEK